MAIALHYAARSDVGLVRQENQDSGYAGPHLLVVADGMGGHAAGDVASSIAIGEMVGLDGDSHGADDALDVLAEALRAANRELRQAMRHRPELQGMGTTVTALLRTGNKIAVAHIGDSRAYLRSSKTVLPMRTVEPTSTGMGLISLLDPRKVPLVDPRSSTNQAASRR